MTQRDENRAAFPEAAKFLDDFRNEFGEGVKLMYANENGSEIGNASACKFELDGEEFLRLGVLCLENTAMVNKAK